MFVCPECGAGYDARGYCPAHGAELVDRDTDLLLGHGIGPYRIARLLGIGGMGRVYLGVHPDIGSRVAIKVLSADRIADTHLVHRFFDEARAVNLIRHEAIVNVLDLSTLPDGRPYIVMEFLDGAPLSAVIRRGPLPLGGLARAMGEVLGALQAAHDKGIVHRDLKPDNIFMSPNGRPKVLDFGIAKLIPELGGSTDPTRTGSLLGTPHYMSPEQALARGVDARADIYAAGVILFEAATGRRPFDSSSLFDLMRQHLEEPPPAPRSLRADMPDAYEQVILQALAKQPDDRFQSARALAEALTSACRTLPADAWEPLRATVADHGPAMPSPTPQHTPQHTPSSEHVPHLPTPTPRGLTDKRPPDPSDAFAPTVAAQPGEPRKRPAWLVPAATAIIAAGAATALVLALTGRNEARAPAAVASGVTDASPVAADAAPVAVRTAVADAAVPAAPDAATVVAVRPVAAPNKPRPPKPDAAPVAAPAKTAPRDSSIPSPPSKVGFDPARFDVSKYLRTANRRAKRHWDDAVFVRVDAEGVFPDGHANLTLDDSFSVLYRFISPSRAKGDPDLPIGVAKKVTCVYYVNVTEAGVSAWEVPNWDCDDYTPIPLPKCSLKQVWKKAIRDGAPAKRAVASIGMWAGRNGTARWSFSVKDHFSSWIDDDC